jgi:hypothetical protein
MTGVAAPAFGELEHAARTRATASTARIGLPACHARGNGASELPLVKTTPPPTVRQTPSPTPKPTTQASPKVTATARPSISATTTPRPTPTPTPPAR